MMNKRKKIYVPPIKIQGKKTQLVPFIRENLPEKFDRWIEPFTGSGVVGFNVQPRKAVFADNNPHIINFYNHIKAKKITPNIAREFLQHEGAHLAEKGAEHYAAVRERFNAQHAPLDFLFLNRSCFNGMIRFNKKFGFNVPYGHKPNRFAPAYVTKIVNQIKQVAAFIETNDWQFICQDFKQTLADTRETDLIYCDPPYIGRHVDYFDSWTLADELELEKQMRCSKTLFIVSTWFANRYRANQHLAEVWKNYNVVTTEHFYHFGGKGENRNAITEALILNYSPQDVTVADKAVKQMALFAEI
jgi:DNA adenine methylase